MFNEYENDLDPPPPPSPSDSDDESDAEGPEFVMTKTLSDAAKDVVNNLTIWDVQSTIQNAKFEKDYHLSKISNTGGDSLVYDNDSLITINYELIYLWIYKRFRWI